MERLDDALIQLGRVDMKLELGLTICAINARLFFAIFRSPVSDKEVTARKTEVPRVEVLKAEETVLRKLAADFASKVPEHEFSPADVQLFLLGYRNSPTMAVQNVQHWVITAREEKLHPKKANTCVPEISPSDSDTILSDKPTASATTRTGVESRGTAGDLASMEKPITMTEPHCCSCHVLDDIMAICRAEEMPSIEQSLLLNRLSDLEEYRGTHAKGVHSTVGFLNLLLDFVKKTYTCSTEVHSTLSAASSSCPSLPLAARDDLLTLSQPSTKIVEYRDLEPAEAHSSEGDTTIGDLQNFWDKEGWEPLVFDFNHATPDLSYNLHPLDYTYSDASETSPDDSSSGTTFESGSEMAFDDENVVAQAEVTEESAGLKTKSSFIRQPVTPPGTPIMTPVLLSGNQGKEMAGSVADLQRVLENVSKDARLAHG